MSKSGCSGPVCCCLFTSDFHHVVLFIQNTVITSKISQHAGERESSRERETQTVRNIYGVGLLQLKFSVTKNKSCNIFHRHNKVEMKICEVLSLSPEHADARTMCRRKHKESLPTLLTRRHG